MNRSIGLDFARFCAIGMVLMAHSAKKLEPLGLFGVELFFSLSGFLIGGILYRNLTQEKHWSMESVKTFWLRRWWRTLPNYYLFFLISILFHYWQGGLPSASHMIKYLFFAQGLLHPAEGFYGVSWSLCIEEWFYLTFPLVLYILSRLSSSKKTAFLIAVVPFLAVPPILREHFFLSMDPSEVRKLTIARLDAIFYGVLISVATVRIPLQKRMQIFLFSMGFSCVTGVAAYDFWISHTIDKTAYYRAALVLLPAGFSLMLPFAATIKTFPMPIAFLSQFITNISLWSYSIYLSHIPVLFAVYALFGESRQNLCINMISKVIGISICILISRFLYVHYECKLTNMRPPERKIENLAIDKASSQAAL